jgi:integrase
MDNMETLTYDEIKRRCNKSAVNKIRKNCFESDNKNHIKSVGTIRNYVSCTANYLCWCIFNNIASSNESDKANLVKFLREASDFYRQKTLDQYRMALQSVFNKKLAFIKAKVKTILSARDYELCEVLAIIDNLEPKNAISILLCFFSGLRAHELATLRRIDEGAPTATKEWTDQLFLMEDDFVRYLVVGKGGLCRQVAIPSDLAVELEKFRLAEPQRVRDREIFYDTYYSIGFGQAISQCFTRASLKVYGWSKGLHGLRHSFAKNRIKKLTDNGITFHDAIAIVSQELGHFRIEIIFSYLR